MKLGKLPRCEVCGHAIRGAHYSTDWCNEEGIGVALHATCCTFLIDLGRLAAVDVLRTASPVWNPKRYRASRAKTGGAL